MINSESMGWWRMPPERRGVASAKQVLHALPEAAFGFRRQAARHHRHLLRILALRFGAPAIPGIDPGHFQPGAGRRRQRRGGQLGKQVAPGAQAAAGTEQRGRLVVVTAHPEHRQMLAGEAGEPAVAHVVAGAGLAGGVQPAQAGIADRAGGAVLGHLLHRPGGQAHRILVFAGARLHLIALDRAAIAIHHAAHRKQGQRMSVGGEVLIELGHLEWRQVDRADQQRRAGIDGTDVEGFQERLDPRQADLQAQVDRRQVPRMRQRIHHDQRIVAAVVVVLWRPHAAVGLAHG